MVDFKLSNPLPYTVKTAREFSPDRQAIALMRASHIRAIAPFLS
ncbi:hypothetical protein [Nostoc mirabile]|nr:hypothetical protein [Nostoc mirabile]